MKILKLLTFLSFFLSSLAASSCGIDSDISNLKAAQTDMDKEDILYAMSTTLLFCGPGDYTKAVLASFEYTSFGDHFVESFLYQYKQSMGRSYQIGDDWNRKEMSSIIDSGLDHHILRVGSATGVYLGKYEGQSLIATNRHVVRGKECPTLEISNTRDEKINCSKIIRTGSDLDYAFILSDTVIAEAPLDIEWKKMQKSTALLTAGRGYSRNEEQEFLEEDSDLCQIFLADKDGETMGCDSSPGDSGSPVFLKKEKKLYALANSTGSYILSFTNDTIKKILADKKLHGIFRLQSSHMVPFYRIKEDLSNSSVNFESKKIISCIINKGCLE